MDIADLEKLNSLWRKGLVSRVGLTDNCLIESDGGVWLVIRK